MANQYTAQRGLGKGSPTIIVRVTPLEKIRIKGQCILLDRSISKHVRVLLGLEPSTEDKPCERQS